MYKEHSAGKITLATKSINKFKKFEIISSIFSEYNSMKLEIDYKKRKTQTCGR